MQLTPTPKEPAITPQPDRAALETYASRVRGCLLGGAIGDALGGPVEFWDLAKIRAEVGDAGVRAYVVDHGSYGRITDDTQMTLFTVEGMIRASVRTDRGIGFTRAVVHNAYLRWLKTQETAGPDGSSNGWLISEAWLYARRAPGVTCLTALREVGTKQRLGDAANNDSKGCGGVMRSAPFGLTWPWIDQDWQFESAAEVAGYTHGHPTGQLASGALAVMIGAIVAGSSLTDAVQTALSHLSRREHHEETTTALQRAIEASHNLPSAAVMESLGAGWVAEEALAMATYAALSYPAPDQMLDALALAVTHSGDSDSTGAICGNILGALHGETALPVELAFEVEGRPTILTLADDFLYEFTKSSSLHGDYGPFTRWNHRYPGG